LSSTGCLECQRLFGEAAAATLHHIEAVCRFQAASIQDKAAIMPALEALVEKTRLTREDATDAYRLPAGLHIQRLAA